MTLLLQHTRLSSDVPKAKSRRLGPDRAEGRRRG